MIVENRPGAGSTIGTERVAQSPPDGYTLLMMPTSAVVQSVLRTNLTYNMERDLQPISLVASGPFVLMVHPSVPARSVKGLVAIARTQPGKLRAKGIEMLDATVSGTSEMCAVKDIIYKDVRLMLALGARLDCPLPLISLHAQALASEIAKGRADWDSANIISFYDELANLGSPQQRPDSGSRKDS